MGSDLASHDLAHCILHLLGVVELDLCTELIDFLLESDEKTLYLFLQKNWDPDCVKTKSSTGHDFRSVRHESNVSRWLKN